MSDLGSWAARQAVAIDWLDQGRRVAAAMLIETVGSAPLDPGAEMLVDDSGRIEGSVTGGCVEGALVEVAAEVLAGGEARVVTYGISDHAAADVGLMCGGTVSLFVHELSDSAREPLSAAREALEAGKPVALATVLDGEAAGAKLAVSEELTIGSLGSLHRLATTLRSDALGCLDHGISTVRRYSSSGEVMGSDLRVYIQGFASPPQMVIFGAIDFSVAVARLARELGYKVTICDARAPFVESPRFAEVAEVAVDWPDRHLAGRELGPRDVVLVFTHDSKFDQPALIGALETGAGYIGALGSRRTHAERRERLRDAGVPEGQLGRISAPCGLDIGARTPTETAVSIMAEVIAARTGRRGEQLSGTSGPIHQRQLQTA
ncbi:MAG: XdhC family protein [Actinomycetota bacterium]|nr:XdhC family protein [Actinomycetota bacterium]